MTRARGVALLLLIPALSGLPARGVAAAPDLTPAPPPRDLASGSPTHADGEVSRLGFPRPPRSSAGELLAQRVIDREWGPSDDSVYVELEIIGWKSEPLATALSAVIPGAGQLYVGRRRAWLFAAAELVGWGGWWWYRRDARRFKDDAAGVAGAPDDTASGWSFERWASATEGDPSEIAALYAADREAFYDRIGSDPAYQQGWVSAASQTRFVGLEARAEDRLYRSRWYAVGVWLNHLVAAVDALRVSRFHNIPLDDFSRVRIDGQMSRAGPSMTLALERRF
jgi:hypothetical protein